MAKTFELGTILPDAETHRLENEFYNRQVAAAAKIASHDKLLKKCCRKIVGGELRYYLRENIYAVVGLNSLKVLWFEVRLDGEFSIDRPKH